MMRTGRHQLYFWSLDIFVSFKDLVEAVQLVQNQCRSVSRLRSLNSLNE